MFTIAIMARNGSSHREIAAINALSADTIACREAAALKRTHVVVMHDGETWRRVMPAGAYRTMTTAEVQNLGLN